MTILVVLLGAPLWFDFLMGQIWSHVSNETSDISKKHFF